MSYLIDRLLYWADNEEMIDAHYTQHGNDCKEAAAEIERLNKVMAVKDEFIHTRQCADHNGKWERGTCLQCEVERLRELVARQRIERDVLA